jgi:hypothetical protein
MQCEWMTEMGRCARPCIEGSKFCESHSPHKGELRLNQYLISKKLLGDSPARHAAADEVKSLKMEIVLLRTLVERRLNMIETDAELASAMSSLKDTFLAIEKLVSSCHNMEVKLGNLLNKSALVSLAQKIVHIIDQKLADIPGRDELVAEIGEDIAKAIAEQENQQK